LDWFEEACVFLVVFRVLDWLDEACAYLWFFLVEFLLKKWYANVHLDASLICVYLPCAACKARGSDLRVHFKVWTIHNPCW
jgi:hypothetical protein